MAAIKKEVSIEKFPMTKEKKAAFEKEIQQLKSVDRPAVLKLVESARALGDLSENAEYHAARDSQGRIGSRIGEVEHMLKYHEIIEKNENGIIGLTSVATILKEGSDAEKVFTIVTEQESNLLDGKIADTSPIGSALIGKRIGETAIVETPKGSTQYRIIAVD